MKAPLLLSLLSVAMLMQGCSSRQVYDGLRERQRIECQQLPKSEYEDCLDRVDMGYEEYRRKRKEIKDDE